MFSNDLDFLARKYGTDKRTNNPGQNIYHGYVDTYYEYLKDLREFPVNLLEIGVREGWSHRMWFEFFKNGHIWGIDDFSDPACSVPVDKIANDRIHILVGDQTDEKLIGGAFYDIMFHVIIDDGSHRSWHQQKSFRLLWDYLLPNGYYFIEDLGVCAIREFRQFDDPLSSTLHWLHNLKEGNAFSYYLSDFDMHRILNEIESIEIVGELAIIKKKNHIQNWELIQLLKEQRMYEDPYQFDNQKTIDGMEVNRLAGLADLITENLSSDSIVAEIGSARGRSSELFALLCGKVYCIDPWEESEHHEKQFDKLLKHYKNIVKLKKRSEDTYDDFPDGLFDFVYIDGGHSYDDVLRDIDNWTKKVKPGGYIGGHDYHEGEIGIIRAVNNRFNGKEIKLYKDSSWIVRVE